MKVMTQLKCFGIGSCFCSFVLSSSFLFRCCWFSCNGMDAPSFCAFFHVQMRCVALELLSNLSIQTRRVICRVNIVNSSFFFPRRNSLFLLCVSSVDGSTRESAFPTKTKLVKYYIIRRFDIENYIYKSCRETVSTYTSRRRKTSHPW